MKVIIKYTDGRKSRYYNVDAIMRTRYRLKLLRKGEVHHDVAMDKIVDFNLYDDRRDK